MNTQIFVCIKYTVMGINILDIICVIQFKKLDLIVLPELL